VKCPPTRNCPSVVNLCSPQGQPWQTVSGPALPLLAQTFNYPRWLVGLFLSSPLSKPERGQRGSLPLSLLFLWFICMLRGEVVFVLCLCLTSAVEEGRKEGSEQHRNQPTERSSDSAACCSSSTLLRSSSSV
jgi:hypothetical protein